MIYEPIKFADGLLLPRNESMLENLRVREVAALVRMERQAELAFVRPKVVPQEVPLQSTIRCPSNMRPYVSPSGQLQDADSWRLVLGRIESDFS